MTANSVDCPPGGESGTVTWLDAAGHAVAVETFGFTTWSITCSEGGETTECQPGCGSDAPGLNYGRNCTSGSCP